MSKIDTRTTYNEVVEALYRDFKKESGYDKDSWFEFDQAILMYLSGGEKEIPAKLTLKQIKRGDMLL